MSVDKVTRGVGSCRAMPRKPTGRPPGRPKGSGTGRKPSKLERIDLDTRERLEVIAARLGALNDQRDSGRPLSFTQKVSGLIDVIEAMALSPEVAESAGASARRELARRLRGAGRKVSDAKAR
jgi:hypothetical protein